MALSPATLSKFPAGLLSFFNIKNGGRNPQAIAEYLQPVLNLMPHYTALDRRTTSTAFNAAAVNSQSVVSVPQSEAWLLEQLIVISPVLGAGVTLQLQPVVLCRGITGLAGVPQRAAAGEQIIATYTPTQPLLLAPGDALGVATNAIVAGPVNGCDLRVTYVPMPF